MAFVREELTRWTSSRSRRPVLPNEQPQTAAVAGAGARAGNGGAAGAAAPGANGAGPTIPVPADALDAENAAIRQAQVNLARNLGREAFTSLFPGIPFPPEAEDVARRPQNASSEGTGAPQAAEDLRPTPTQPVVSPPNPPAASTSGGADAAANDADNPLARFSLPSLPVPAGGEASLYHSPPNFAYPAPGASTSAFSDLAYGAYPQLTGTRQAPTPFGATSRRPSPPNLIERIETVRTRWESRGGARVAAEAEGEVGRPSEAAAPSTTVGVSDEHPETRSPTTEEKGKGKAVEDDGRAEASSTETVSPKEAALRAAERRLGERAAASSTASPGAASAEAVAAVASSTPSSEVSAGGIETSPLPPPRLIPLFDPTDPASVRAASLRAPLDGALPAIMTHVELEGAVSETMQGKLRQLTSFQARIDRLVEEMRDTLGGTS